jgi:hypothetical protein
MDTVGLADADNVGVADDALREDEGLAPVDSEAVALGKADGVQELEDEVLVVSAGVVGMGDWVIENDALLDGEEPNDVVDVGVNKPLVLIDGEPVDDTEAEGELGT